MEEKNLRILDFSRPGDRPGQEKAGAEKATDKKSSGGEAEPKKRP
mgnify:FL=1